MRISKPMMVLLLLLSTFFNYGCTATQRRAIVEEAVNNAKNYVTTTVIPEMLDKAGALVDEKLKAAELKKLNQLDEQLKPLGKIDPDTGMVDSKTWRDFDADRSGDLSPGELAKVQFYVLKRTVAKVVAGELAPDEAGRIAKDVGITLTALLALFAGKRGVDKLRNKKNGAGIAAATGATPTPPTTPS